VAYVAQRFGLLRELSVGENIALPLRLGGGRHAVPDEALAEALGLDELLARDPLETSLGQQQRIAVARALAVRPSVLLADEPTSHQDARSADQVWAALRSACTAGTACLGATHDERLAARADRVWLIEDGRVRPG
jgi:putative ABC transport system ATP-binding protein